MSLTWLRARSLPALVSLGALAGVLSISGCKQGVGDRCEIDSDCSSGICGPPPGNPGGSVVTSAAGLRCSPANSAPTTEVDSGSGAAEGSNDAAVPDAGSDASDAAETDATGTDGAAEAGTDAAPSADGATDAGTDGAAAGG